MLERLLPKPQPPPKQGGQALRTQCQKQLDQGPLTTPKPPLAPPLAPPTPAENGGPSDTAVRSETGGQSPRVQFARGYVITPFLPHFYPLEGKMLRFYPIFTPFLPPFYPVAPISFYPSG